MTRPGHGPRRRRMMRGTIVRTGGLAVRYGRQRSQLARIDCTSSRRSTVMCALSRATAITTEYQRDSSSKRPRSSVVFAAREPVPHLRKRPAWWTLHTAHATRWNTRSGFHHYRSPPASIDKRSFHIRQARGKGRNPTPSRGGFPACGVRLGSRRAGPAVDSESRSLVEALGAS